MHFSSYISFPTSLFIFLSPKVSLYTSLSPCLSHHPLVSSHHICRPLNKHTCIHTCIYLSPHHISFPSCQVSVSLHAFTPQTTLGPMHARQANVCIHIMPHWLMGPEIFPSDITQCGRKWWSCWRCKQIMGPNFFTGLKWSPRSTPRGVTKKKLYSCAEVLDCFRACFERISSSPPVCPPTAFCSSLR